MMRSNVVGQAFVIFTSRFLVRSTRPTLRAEVTHQLSWGYESIPVEVGACQNLALSQRGGTYAE